MQADFTSGGRVQLRLLAYRAAAAILGTVLITLMLTGNVSAATIQVTTSTDENGANPAACSLREAITAITAGANGGGGCVATGAYGSADRITFAPSTNGVPIPLTNGALLISQGVQIVGNGAANTIIDGQKGTASATRVFTISDGVSSMDGLTIRNGQASGGGLNTLGGAIFLRDAALAITNSAFSGNIAVGSSGLGGAIFVREADLTVTDTTFSANTGDGGGGGVYLNLGTSNVVGSTFTGNSTGSSGGGLATEGGAVTVTNSTFTNNSASGVGGGVAIMFNATATIVNSTISNNTSATNGGGLEVGFASTGAVAHTTFSGNSGGTSGGIHLDHTGGASTVSLRGVILDTGASGANCPAGVTSLGSNLSDDGSCGLGQTGDVNNATLNLGPRQDNGGPTHTHALLPGSAAIDAIQGFCTQDGTFSGPAVSTDQRGISRPSGAACDAGAFEAGALAPGSLQFSAPTFTVSEAGPTTSVTVTRTGGSDFQVGATVALTGGTATAPADFDSTALTVSFAAGDTTAKTVTIPLVDDALDEADETIMLTLTSPTGGATLGAQAAATLTLTDNDLAPTLSVNDVTLAEGNAGSTAFTFTVTLSAASGQQITVQAQTADGTAMVAAGDYAATGPTILTFVPGDTSETFLVQVNGNTTNEAAKTFVVNLTNATSATILDNQGIGTISNDDGLPAFSIASLTATEGHSASSNTTFTVSRTGASALSATVQYATVDGSATAGVDYVATSGTLTFAPNESSRTIVVSILGDTIVEPDETFTVTLSNPTNAVLGTAQAVGTIANDDLGACTPRPRVTRSLSTDGAALRVHVEATPLNTQTNNSLQQIRFGTLQNATVTLSGQAITSGQTVSLPANTFAADFVVRRVTPGQSTTVPFTVVDACGDWNTFVGGGAGAGF